MGKQKTDLREERFAREYIIDLNGTEAAIRAGYAKRSAHVQASRLLRKDKVKDLIAQLTLKQAEKLDITAERVLHELAVMGYANLQDFSRVTADGLAGLDLRNLTRDQWAAVQEITSDTAGMTIDPNWNGQGEPPLIPVVRTKIKLANKVSSLELLGKYLKLFIERSEVTGPGGGPVPVQIVSHIPRPKRSGDGSTQSDRNLQPVSKASRIPRKPG